MLVVINMIEIGLTGWGDHDTLYEDLGVKRISLRLMLVIFNSGTGCFILCDSARTKHIKMDK